MEKEKNNSIVVFLIMLVVVLIVVVALFMFGTFDLNNNKNEKSTKDDKVVSIKLDDTKDYVYDANYKYANKYSEFSRGTDDKKYTVNQEAIPVVKNGKEALKDLKVPYINIKSNDATKVNKELEQLYLKNAKIFDECADLKQKMGDGCSQILTYKVYNYNDILSVVVIYGEQMTSPYEFEYNVYNFDLKTGSLISYTENLNKLGFAKDATFNKIKEQIKHQMNKIYSDIGEDLTKACHNALGDDDKPLYNTKDCYEITYKLLQEEIDNNKVLFFVDNAGNLNVLSVLYYDGIQNGDTRRYLIKIK